MASEDRRKREERSAAHEEPREPCEFLKEIFQAGSWPMQPGRALDIAAGQGRNALFLAERGFTVEAVDISDAALQITRKRAEDKGLVIVCTRADLGKIDLPETAYDLIVNFNFLQRSLIPKLKAALTLGGHVIFETFLVDQRALGHPKNPDYLLGHNELLELFKGLRVLWYREGKFGEGERAAFRAGLLARRVR